MLSNLSPEAQAEFSRLDLAARRAEERFSELERSHAFLEDDLQQRECELEALKKSVAELKSENSKLRHELADEREEASRLYAQVKEAGKCHSDGIDGHYESNNGSGTVVSNDASHLGIIESDESRAKSNLAGSEIESLRLELADLHLQLISVESQHKATVNKLEQDLLEARMTNLQLTEELSELDSLSGARTSPTPTSPATPHTTSPEKLTKHHSPSTESTSSFDINEFKAVSSLAEEILAAANVPKNATVFNDLEKENKDLRESNLAMATYIERIIQKLLDNKALEHILESSTANSKSHSEKRELKKKKKPLGIGIVINPSTKDSVFSPVSTPILASSQSQQISAVPSSAQSSARSVSFPGPLSPGGPLSPNSVQSQNSNYRRVASGGQTSLRPLLLADGKSPTLAQLPRTKERPVSAGNMSASSPDEENSKSGKKKRNSWMTMFGTSSA
ncbi:hypothetical protein V1511DRAFT_456476 [Dipodascopsis uninucleata]